MSVYPNVGLCHCRTPTGWNRTWLQSFLPPRPRRSRLWACSISSEPSAACALGRNIWYVLTVASRGLSSARSNLDLLPLCLPFVDGSRFLAREHFTISMDLTPQMAPRYHKRTADGPDLAKAPLLTDLAARLSSNNRASARSLNEHLFSHCARVSSLGGPRLMFFDAKPPHTRRGPASAAVSPLPSA